jgi:prohibitin 2
MRRLLKKFHDAVFEWYHRHRVAIYITTFVFIFLIAYFFNRIFIVVPPGHQGVLFRIFTTGTVLTQSFDEGLMVVFPWNRVYIYDTRIQEAKIDVSVLSSNGLIIEVTLSARYHPNPFRVGELHKLVGLDYAMRIVHPVIIDAVREMVGGLRPEDIYATHRHQLADQILQ